MDFPGFITIETGDEDAIPVAISWALPDGQIKHALIQPDDDWLEEDLLKLGDYSLDELRSLGLSPLDVLRELETDHFNVTLYTAGIGDDEAALSRLFEDFAVTPFVELAPAETLYPDLEPGEWTRARGELFGDLGLEPMRADHEVQVMLYLHQRLRGEEE